MYSCYMLKIPTDLTTRKLKFRTQLGQTGVSCGQIIFSFLQFLQICSLFAILSRENIKSYIFHWPFLWPVEGEGKTMQKIYILAQQSDARPACHSYKAHLIWRTVSTFNSIYSKLTLQYCNCFYKVLKITYLNQEAALKVLPNGKGRVHEMYQYPRF
jgi:hypothetical protein